MQSKKGFFYYFLLKFLFNNKPKENKSTLVQEEEKSKITVGIVYEHVSARCFYCDCIWEAIIEVDLIDWGNGFKEVRNIENIECPNCSYMTKVKRK